MATAKTPFTPSRKRSTLGKLMPPRLGRVFVRERLFALLDEQAGVPGTWVAGPPGLGKTTLVATYLEARRLQTLWLQIDAQDADLAAFAHFLDLAVADAVPRRRTRMPVPTADDLRDATGFVCRCFRHLAAMLEAPWVLVLDNLQEAAPASPLYAGLAAVLTELPADARLIFISRELPPAAFARALAGQQLVVVDAHALRFTLAETRVLVDLHGHGIAADALQDSTDGWAAAMILIMAARGTGGVDKTRRTGASAVSGSASISTPDSAIDNEPVRGSLFAFFAGEVLAKMPPGDAATLARIAFLPSTTTAMAASLSGDSRAGLLLADLAARSLFTDRRSGAEPVFTFHALFGEFLRAHAAATLTAEARTKDGVSGRSSTSVNVTETKLVLKLEGPKTGVVGEALPFQIKITNEGQTTAEKIRVQARFDEGIETVSKSTTFDETIASLAAGQSRTLPLPLSAKKSGKLMIEAGGSFQRRTRDRQCRMCLSWRDRTSRWIYFQTR